MLLRSLLSLAFAQVWIVTSVGAERFQLGAWSARPQNLHVSRCERIRHQFLHILGGALFSSRRHFPFNCLRLHLLLLLLAMCHYQLLQNIWIHVFNIQFLVLLHELG